MFAGCETDEHWNLPHEETSAKFEIMDNGVPIDSLVLGTSDINFEVVVSDENGNHVPGVAIYVEAPEYIQVFTDNVTNELGKVAVTIRTGINPLSQIKDRIIVGPEKGYYQTARIPFTTASQKFYIRDRQDSKAVFIYPPDTTLGIALDNASYSASVNGSTLVIMSDGRRLNLGGNEALTGYVIVDGIRTKFSLPVYNGDGSIDYPYAISTKEDLERVSANCGINYFLSKDINLDAEAWNPLCAEPAPFTGVLSGDNKTIKGLYIGADSGDCLGLFCAVNGGQIYDLNIDGVINAPDSEYVGLLAGKMNGKQLRNVSANGTVSGKNTVGLLVGASVGEERWFIDNGTTVNPNFSASAVIDKAFVKGTVYSAGGKAGGIAGQIKYTALENSYSYADVVSSGDYTGGVVGMVERSFISHTYAVGSVRGKDYVGGIFGINYGIAMSRRSSVVYASLALQDNITGTGLNIHKIGYFNNWDALIPEIGGNKLTSLRHTRINGELTTSSDGTGMDGNGRYLYKIKEDWLSEWDSTVWELLFDSREFALPILWGRRGTAQDTLKMPVYLKE